jgi:hypothetical protein
MVKASSLPFLADEREKNTRRCLFPGPHDSRRAKTPTESNGTYAELGETTSESGESSGFPHGTRGCRGRTSARRAATSSRPRATSSCPAETSARATPPGVRPSGPAARLGGTHTEANRPTGESSKTSAREGATASAALPSNVILIPKADSWRRRTARRPRHTGMLPSRSQLCRAPPEPFPSPPAARAPR